MQSRQQEERQQQIFQAAQGVVEPGRQFDILAENKPVQAVQIFGQQSKGTDPAAKASFKKNGCGQDHQQNDQSGRVYLIEPAADHPVFKADQGAYRQKGFYAWRAGNGGPDTVFQLADKNEEFEADQKDRRQEKVLDYLAVKLNVGS